MLRVKYGWEGEGKFWALNNMIADSDQCQLDLSRKFIVADILDLFQMQHDEFTNFINFLVEDCELINRVGDIITTETVQENYSKVMSKRVRNKTDYEAKTTEPEIQNSEIPINSFIQNFQTSENIQSKVKESKVKESKLKESKVNEIVPPNEETFLGTSLFPNTHKIETYIKNLYIQNTRILNPNQHKHINPILKILKTIPPELTDQDIKNCLTEIFQKLNKGSGVKMEFLLQNIRKSISIKHEEILTVIKTANLSYKEIEPNKTNEFFRGAESLSNVFSIHNS